MEWSEKFPKVEGFYWFRYRNNETGLGKPVIIAISMSYLNGEEFGMSATRIGDDEIYMDTDFKGVWFGPITPPKSDTVEAVEQPLTQVKTPASPTPQAGNCPECNGTGCDGSDFLVPMPLCGKCGGTGKLLLT